MKHPAKGGQAPSSRYAADAQIPIPLSLHRDFAYPCALGEINKFFSSADEKLFGQILFFIFKHYE
jgi:hypothetical protein